MYTKHKTHDKLIQLFINQYYSYNLNYIGMLFEVKYNLTFSTTQFYYV